MEDVIIVGAGPAGAMAARIISKTGYSVLVIDKKSKVGYPVQCAEAFSRYSIESNGLRLDESWIRQRLDGIKIFVPNGKYFYFLEDFLSIDRCKFDKWLMDKAVSLGSKLMLKTQVIGIKRKSGFWEVKTDKKTFRCRVLVGADGYKSSVSEWLGIIKKKECLNAINYKFRKKDIDFPDDKLCGFHGPKFVGGYAWVFPRGEEFNIGICITDDFSKAKQDLDGFCKSMGFDIKKKIMTNTGFVPVNYSMKSYVKNDVLIVGDAAGLTNPILGGGIHAALISGRVAGDTIVEAFQKNDMNILKKYDRMVSKHPISDPVLQRAREIFYSFNEDEWNFVGDIFYNRDWRKVSNLKVLIKFIQNPGLLMKIGKFLKTKKAMDISGKYGV